MLTFWRRSGASSDERGARGGHPTRAQRGDIPRDLPAGEHEIGRLRRLGGPDAPGRGTPNVNMLPTNEGAP